VRVAATNKKANAIPYHITVFSYQGEDPYLPYRRTVRNPGTVLHRPIDNPGLPRVALFDKLV